MRWSRNLVAPVLMILVVACSSPGGTSGDDDGGNGTQQSEAPDATPPATNDDGGGDDGGGDDGGNNGGGNAGDAEAAFERLTPPNAEQVTKTTAEGIVFAAFNSPDSVESLTSFYEDAFNDLGLDILQTTESSGAISWFVGTDENASEFGGVVTIVPPADGAQTAISVQIGATNQ